MTKRTTESWEALLDGTTPGPWARSESAWEPHDVRTADLHIGHEKVAQLRGFDSTTHHDYHVLDTITDTLQPGDRLWILGDLSGGRGEDEALDHLAALSDQAGAELHLIAGNHDSIHPMHRHSEERHEEFREVFASIDSLGTFRHNKAKVLLSHFPYQGDHREERYPEYRLRDLGTPLIHGHTHATEKVDRTAVGTLQICVSLDAWNLKPASKEHITKLINQEEA